MQSDVDDDTSPESKVVPFEDMNLLQMKISGERLPEVLLELCDRCNWSLICFNRRGIVQNCPDCGMEVSLIPMSIDEVCSIEYDESRGVTIRFGRKKPVR
jgi:hypothetical protein